jgi:hypothetical protein
LLLWTKVAVTVPVPLLINTRAYLGANKKLLCLVAATDTTFKSEELTQVTFSAVTGLNGSFGSSRVA